MSQRHGMVSPAVLGAMRRHGRGLRHVEPVRDHTAASSVDAAPASACELPSQDWAALFGAVTERLQRLARVDAAAAVTGPALRLPLQECVDALRQLHRGLGESLQSDTQLRAELAAARSQLAGTRAELAGTQVDRQRAEHAALHDGLTRLPNRGHFHARLADSVGAARGETRSVAVLFIDLDGFKRINDEFGHDVGDATLCIVAQRLARALRAQDTVCRLGGDEFACLLDAAGGREQLAKVACKLFDAVAAPLKVGTRHFSVMPSIGIAVDPADGTSGTTLLQRADAAMFTAKRRQQGYAFFEEHGAP
ncbi:MAG: GGDEF domain-containing protein [Rubrivivax sp.]|nr:GGDEF domain-containing protein [Rubrivivax sp.]